MPHVRFAHVTSRAEIEEKDDCDVRAGDDASRTMRQGRRVKDDASRTMCRHEVYVRCVRLASQQHWRGQARCLIRVSQSHRLFKAVRGWRFQGARGAPSALFFARMIQLSALIVQSPACHRSTFPP
jgi:hypothetical protein